MTRLSAQDVLGACVGKTHYNLGQKGWLRGESDAELSSKDEWASLAGIEISVVVSFGWANRSSLQFTFLRDYFSSVVH